MYLSTFHVILEQLFKGAFTKANKQTQKTTTAEPLMKGLLVFKVMLASFEMAILVNCLGARRALTQVLALLDAHAFSV